jgi:hypothetical protein
MLLLRSILSWEAIFLLENTGWFGGKFTGLEMAHDGFFEVNQGIWSIMCV